MKKYEFVRLVLKNNPVTNAYSENHRQIIAEWAAKGYRYAGYMPVKQGASGKIVEMDLIFETEV